jgi:hypothetical protein
LAKTGQQFLERFAGYSCHCPYQAVIVENAFQFQHLLSTLQLLVIIPYFPTGLVPLEIPTVPLLQLLHHPGSFELWLR